MVEELFPIQENEYNELLLQTVAVIENARINVARRIAATASNTYWDRQASYVRSKYCDENCYGA